MCETKCWADANAIIGLDLGETLNNVIDVLMVVDSVITPRDNKVFDEVLYTHGACLMLRAASDAMLYARDFQSPKPETP